MLPSCPLVEATAPTSHCCRSLGTSVLGDMAASFLSTNMSFCASPAESISLADHEKAFIPSPPRGQITLSRTVCCRLAPGSPVTPGWGPSTALMMPPLGSWSKPQLHWGCTSCICSWAGSKLTAALGREGTWLWPHLCFWPSYLYLLNKDATVMWAERRPQSSPAPWSPAPQPSAAQALGSTPGPTWGSPSRLHTCDSLLGNSALNGRHPQALQTPQHCSTFPSTVPCCSPAPSLLNVNCPPQLPLRHRSWGGLAGGLALCLVQAGFGV